jgi:hypothetical protein
MKDPVGAWGLGAWGLGPGARGLGPGAGGRGPGTGGSVARWLDSCDWACRQKVPTETADCRLAIYQHIYIKAY